MCFLIQFRNKHKLWFKGWSLMFFITDRFIEYKIDRDENIYYYLKNIYIIVDIALSNMSTPRVGIIIKFNDKYLSVFQDASKLWGFPKGRIQENESLVKCGLRELKEETNIELTEEQLGPGDLIHIKRGKHHHYYYLIELNYEPSCQIDNDEIKDFKWVTLKEFSSIRNVSFFTDQVLRKLTLFTTKRREKESDLVSNKVINKENNVFDRNLWYKKNLFQEQNKDQSLSYREVLKISC